MADGAPLRLATDCCSMAVAGDLSSMKEKLCASNRPSVSAEAAWWPIWRSPAPTCFAGPETYTEGITDVV